MFALVADGKNGLRVIQLISPDTVPGARDSVRDRIHFIATFPIKGEACVSRGLDRDRVVDERRKTVVFGRAAPAHSISMKGIVLFFDAMKQKQKASTDRTKESIAWKMFS